MFQSPGITPLLLALLQYGVPALATLAAGGMGLAGAMGQEKAIGPANKLSLKQYEEEKKVDADRYAISRKDKEKSDAMEKFNMLISNNAVLRSKLNDLWAGR